MSPRKEQSILTATGSKITKAKTYPEEMRHRMGKPYPEKIFVYQIAIKHTFAYRGGNMSTSDYIRAYIGIVLIIASLWSPADAAFKYEEFSTAEYCAAAGEIGVTRVGWGEERTPTKG